MRDDIRERLKEFSRLAGRLKTPQDLERRGISVEDYIDTAVIGGVSVADLIAGKIAEWQIPREVEQAFRLQYPRVPYTFVEEVNRLSGHPEQLRGLINGVKGKLFEIDYAGWLNHGHLPQGYTAELAHSATNPAWDIVIHDDHGHIDQLLQMKATESVAYVQDAIAAHPNIDVVVPHELYGHLLGRPEFLGHVIDSHDQLAHLENHVDEGISHAVAAEIHFEVPIVAFLFAAGQNYLRYRKGSVSLESALRNFGERSVLAMVANGVGWAASAVAHKTIVGIPFAMTTRMFGRQLFHNRDRRKVLDMHIDIVRTSRKYLELRYESASGY